MNRRARKNNVAPLIELLESRAMLAADLTAAFSAPTVGVSVNSGQAQAVTLHVQNDGDAQTSKFKVDFYLYQGEFSTAGLTPVASYTRNPPLKANASFDAVVAVPIPANTLAGQYRIAAVVDAGLSVTESNEDNNTTSTPTINVTQPDYDLTATFGDIKLPSSIVQGKAVKGSAKVNINLIGNAGLPAKQTVGLQVILRPTAGDDVVIGSIAAQTLSGLTSSKPKTVNVNLSILASLPPGSYTLHAIVDPTTLSQPRGRLAESNENNNTRDAGFTFISAPAFVDTGITTASHSFPANATSGNKASASATLKNFGNADATGTGTVTFVARRNGEADKTLGTASVALKLKPGATLIVKATLTIPSSLTDDATYTVVALFTPPANGAGDTTGNNSFTTANSFTASVPPPSFPALGNQVRFTSETRTTPDLASSITIMTQGTYVDGNGNTGTFNLLWLAANFQQSNPDATRGKVTSIQFFNSSGTIVAATTLIANPTHGAVKSVKNKTLVFTIDSTGTSEGTATGSTAGTVFYDLV